MRVETTLIYRLGITLSRVYFTVTTLFITDEYLDDGFDSSAFAEELTFSSSLFSSRVSPESFNQNLLLIRPTLFDPKYNLCSY